MTNMLVQLALVATIAAGAKPALHKAPPKAITYRCYVCVDPECRHAVLDRCYIRTPLETQVRRLNR